MLKYLRQQKSINQSELASLMHVDQRTVSTWEVGRTLPKPFQMSFLEDYYNMPKKQIFLKYLTTKMS